MFASPSKTHTKGEVPDLNIKTPPFNLGYREIVRLVKTKYKEDVNLNENEQLIKMKPVESLTHLGSHPEFVWVVLHIRVHVGDMNYGN